MIFQFINGPTADCQDRFCSHQADGESGCIPSGASRRGLSSPEEVRAGSHGPGQTQNGCGRNGVEKRQTETRVHSSSHGRQSCQKWLVPKDCNCFSDLFHCVPPTAKRKHH